ncbi:hypothetical protein DFH94DRAFT_712765 [Russula ochroleuca]|uniref:Uncharacterized protein n=1 Tax=Russula ochroleuca TaxID=152965 RepID=A0A9P5N4Y1_9AGAM|nr:hypothetical protein DFH94DRAFT_712765 [Russula ochroleuca]
MYTSQAVELFVGLLWAVLTRRHHDNRRAASARGTSRMAQNNKGPCTVKRTEEPSGATIGIQSAWPCDSNQCANAPHDPLTSAVSTTQLKTPLSGLGPRSLTKRESSTATPLWSS